MYHIKFVSSVKLQKYRINFFYTVSDQKVRVSEMNKLDEMLNQITVNAFNHKTFKETNLIQNNLVAINSNNEEYMVTILIHDMWWYINCDLNNDCL